MKKKNNFKALLAVKILNFCMWFMPVIILYCYFIALSTNYSKFLQMDTKDMLLFSIKAFIVIIVFCVTLVDILHCLDALAYKIQNNVTFKEAWKQVCIDDCTPDEQQND